MRKKRVDKNQLEVVGQLRGLGFSVVHLHTLGHGVPDLIVSMNGFNLLVELKSSGGKLTKDEKDFHETFTGGICVAFNTKDVVDGFSQYLETLDYQRQKTEETLLRLKRLL